MAKSNHGRVGDALELLNRGLRPFVERELQAMHGDQWQEMVAQTLREDRGAVKATKKDEISWDTHSLLTVMWDQWNAVFRNTLGHTERSLVSELRDVRNRWAHQTPFSSDDAYRALDSIGRLLTAISAPEAKELEEQKSRRSWTQAHGRHPPPRIGVSTDRCSSIRSGSDGTPVELPTRSSNTCRSISGPTSR